MRKILFVTAAMLGACAAQQPPVHGVTPGHKCDATGTESFIGRIRTDSTGAAIQRATRAAVVRWSPPGTMLTMDYREDRVTVWLDQAKRITKIRCG